MWLDRVFPQQLIVKNRSSRKAQEAQTKRDYIKSQAVRENMSGTDLRMVDTGVKNHEASIDPYDEALESYFHGIKVSKNTAALWGRRIHHVAISESVVFALADTGECFCWGGNNNWWDAIQSDSIYQTKWKGNVTPRSQLLLGVKDNLSPKINKYQSSSKNIIIISPSELKNEAIKIVTKYFNLYETPPNPATRDQFYERQLLPKLEYDILKNALVARGKIIKENTKMQLIALLYEDILLETKLLGERGHVTVKQLETLYISFLKKGNKKESDKVLVRLDAIWSPLREIQVSV